MMINATLTITERLGLTAGFETERKKTLRRAESSLKDTAEFDQISCNFPWSDNRLYTTFLTAYMPCHLQTGLLPLTSWLHWALGELCYLACAMLICSDFRQFNNPLWALRKRGVMPAWCWRVGNVVRSFHYLSVLSVCNVNISNCFVLRNLSQLFRKPTGCTMPFKCLIFCVARSALCRLTWLPSASIKK